MNSVLRYEQAKGRKTYEYRFYKGIIVPILTPVDKNEVIDEGKMRKQVDFVIDGGVSGILAFGSNGEFYMTEEDEMMKALKIMLNHASGRVPVYMGIGAISTKKVYPHCKSSGSSWCRRYIGPSAHVSKTNRGGIVSAF